ncbi:MAG: hypothetical protein ACXWV0_07730 [Flavisolibacter sp.]
MMRKIFLLVILFSVFSSGFVLAQEEEEIEERKGFQKDKLFTGGSLSLSFFNQSFLVGVNPVLGYNLTRWADAGIVINYTYASYRDQIYYDDKLRQSLYGGGVFTRLFPVKFLFVQAQVEHNQIYLKYTPPPNSMMATEKRKVSSNSVLVGGGYTTGRNPDGGGAYGYLAVLFEVTKNANSPYIENGRAIPIIRAGINIPLFQGSGYGPN